jgi:hypothetical protein
MKIHIPFRAVSYERLSWGKGGHLFGVLFPEDHGKEIKRMNAIVSGGAQFPGEQLSICQKSTILNPKDCS